MRWACRSRHRSRQTTQGFDAVYLRRAAVETLRPVHVMTFSSRGTAHPAQSGIALRAHLRAASGSCPPSGNAPVRVGPSRAGTGGAEPSVRSTASAVQWPVIGRSHWCQRAGGRSGIALIVVVARGRSTCVGFRHARPAYRCPGRPLRRRRLPDHPLHSVTVMPFFAAVQFRLCAHRAVQLPAGFRVRGTCAATLGRRSALGAACRAARASTRCATGSRW